LEAAISAENEIDKVWRLVEAGIEAGLDVLQQVRRAEYLSFRLDALLFPGLMPFFFIDAASSLQREGDVFIRISPPSKLATMVVGSRVHISAPASMPLMRSSNMICG
jgi:hypothetical protein